MGGRKKAGSQSKDMRGMFRDPQDNTLAMGQREIRKHREKKNENRKCRG